MLLLKRSMEEEKIDTRRKILIALIVLFVFVLPSTLVVVGSMVINRYKQKISWGSGEVPEKVKAVKPSEVLNNKYQYSGKEVTIRGRVGLVPVTCQKIDCPKEDKCCGCPGERSLAMSDPGEVVTQSTVGRLTIFDRSGKQFCQRKVGTCEYSCPDWSVGGIYDVDGMFYAEAPPPGWKMSLNYYFRVSDMRLVKNLSFLGKVGNFWEEIKRLFSGLKKQSGSFVLQ